MQGLLLALDPFEARPGPGFVSRASLEGLEWLWGFCYFWLELSQHGKVYETNKLSDKRNYWMEMMVEIQRLKNCQRKQGDNIAICGQFLKNANLNGDVKSSIKISQTKTRVKKTMRNALVVSQYRKICFSWPPRPKVCLGWIPVSL